MRNSRFDKKNIFAILSIIFILIGIPLTTYMLKNQTAFKSRASDSEEPKNIRITNITEKSFTITYLTNEPTTGSTSYGTNKQLGNSELDDIDKQRGSFSSKRIHSISLINLAPATKYYLTIISGSTTFLDQGSAFQTITAPKIASLSGQKNTLTGKIILPDGNAPPEALVYLNAENSQLLSTTTTKDGTFSFSLKELRTGNLSSYFNLNNDTIFRIVATDGFLESTASASLNKTNSIPTITLSNSYDFIGEIIPASKSAKNSSGFPSNPQSNYNYKPDILSPKEKQSLTDQKPQFRGTSLPSEKVEIIIHSTDLATEVISDSNGNWSYKPSTNLSSGAHTITIRSRDADGIIRTITRSFTVFAAEPQISKIATPSATPTQIISPTLIPSPTIAIAIVTPTSTPFPTLAPIGSKGGLPPTGDSQSIFITIAAIATTAAGIVLFLISHGIPL